MEKIKKRTNEEKDSIKAMGRSNKITETLNSCFEKKSIDEDDEETILRWACMMPSERLFYLLEKIKLEKLNLRK